MPSITLYEIPPTRSARCRWALLEAGLDFESVAGGPEMFGSEELLRVHPLGKFPAALIDGKPLFESAAIATHVADLAPERGLIGASGSWERALHDQWTCFALTELEAWLWSTGLNTFVLPEGERNPSVFEQNAKLARRAAKVLDDALEGQDYLVGDRFTVTDIIVGYAVNWARRQGHLEGCHRLGAYVERLLAREHCTLSKD